MINMNEPGNILETIGRGPIAKRVITNHEMLNEAYAYAKPSSFSRGMRIDIGGIAILLISGTASIDENGKSVHIGDFPAQLRRTFDNITGLLASEGATWHDVVRPFALPVRLSVPAVIPFEESMSNEYVLRS